MKQQKKIVEAVKETFGQSEERPSMDKRILSDASTAMQQACVVKHAETSVSVWRRIMKRLVKRKAEGS